MFFLKNYAPLPGLFYVMTQTADFLKHARSTQLTLPLHKKRSGSKAPKNGAKEPTFFKAAS